MRIEAYGALSDWQSFAARDGERLAAEAAATCRLKDTLPLACLPGYCIVCDATRQIMGRSGATQVAECNRAFVSGNGGILSEQTTLVLEGD